MVMEEVIASITIRPLAFDYIANVPLAFDSVAIAPLAIDSVTFTPLVMVIALKAIDN